MKKVGFYFEMQDSVRKAELVSLMQASPHSSESRILKYLQTGNEAGAVMVIEHDVLVDPPECLGEVLLLSDGEWVWPRSLIHYVQRYHIRLPQEFLDTMAANGWGVPKSDGPISDIPDGHVEM